MAPNRVVDMIINDLDFSDSDDELEILKTIAMHEEQQMEGESSSRPRGSIRTRTVINRDTFGCQKKLYEDYFADSPVFPRRLFRKRFRMRCSLFLCIHQAVEAHDPFFIQRRNCAGKLGLSSFQKMTAALRMLAYGASADSVDEYIRIGASTATECLKKFAKAVIEVFAEQYLRSPNAADIARLLAIGETRGFPGMLGSLDCMHWKWKNCSVAWQGMYTGHIHEPTIILEAVASYDLWIWHAFFGLPGSHNDINVLERSSLFTELSQGRAPPVNYTVNGNQYNMGYYLADSIYPQWETFVKTIPSPETRKEKHFAQLQESTRKDVERAFGVLQARFAIVRGPGRFWDRQTLKNIMMACIILHNMIIEDERHCNGVLELDYDQLDHIPPVQVSHERTIELMEFIRRHQCIRDRGSHSQLQEDLIEHQWQIYSQS